MSILIIESIWILIICYSFVDLKQSWLLRVILECTFIKVYKNLGDTIKNFHFLFLLCQTITSERKMVNCRFQAYTKLSNPTRSPTKCTVQFFISTAVHHLQCEMQNTLIWYLMQGSIQPKIGAILLVLHKKIALRKRPWGKSAPSQK